MTMKRPRKSAELIEWTEQRDALRTVTAYLSAALIAKTTAQRRDCLERAYSASGLFPSDDIGDRIEKFGKAQRVNMTKLAELRDDCAAALVLADERVIPLAAAHANAQVQYRNETA